MRSVLTSIAVINNVEDRCFAPIRVPAFLPFLTPLGCPPQRPGHVFDMNGIDPQISVPQPLHLLLEVLIYPRKTQCRGHEFTAIIAVHVREPHDDQIEAFDLTQFFLRRQLPLGHLEPWLRLIRFLARRRVRFVDHASADFYKGLDFALRCFFPGCDGQVQGT